MGDYVYDHCVLTPSEVSIDVVGIGIDGGRSLSGISKVINYTGGGFVAVTYGGINLVTRDDHKAWNRMAGMLSGSVRTAIVPLWADIVAARDSGGNAMGDSGGPANPTVGGAATFLAGSTLIKIAGDMGLIQGGEWFAIDHGSPLEWRAYRVIEVVAGTPTQYRIAPPLRADIDPGEVLDFWRPKCLMRLQPGANVPWTFAAPGGLTTVDVSFVEAF